MNIFLLVVEFLGLISLGLIVVALTIKILMYVYNFFFKEKCLCSSCENCDVYLELSSGEGIERHVYKHCTLLDLKSLKGAVDADVLDVRECTLYKKKK